MKDVAVDRAVARVSEWLKLDCRHFRGDRPCAAGVQGDCPTVCGKQQPMGVRVLVIKLGALGDVIRTAALLPGIKEAWPRSYVVWVTRPSGVRMLANHPLIDRLLPLDAETLCHVDIEDFDVCLSLDKEPGPAGLAMRVRAQDRRGIGLSPSGTPFPLNRECDDYFRLGLDDELKFRGNTQTYPEMIYRAVGLPYRGQTYTLHPDAAAQRRAARVWGERGVGPQECMIGLNTGAGRVFANKSWPPEKFGQLARRLLGRDERRVALLGGPEEREVNRGLAAAHPGLIDVGCDHDEATFAALVARCRVLVSGDTMALHAAIAQRVAVVALFGPTCAQEIDVFGRGEKIVTRLGCAPCYRRTCDKSPHCMDDISLNEVEAAIERWTLSGAAPHAIGLPLLEPVA
jgi:ADP-heptose:LPS heptosyltransferase